MITVISVKSTIFASNARLETFVGKHFFLQKLYTRHLRGTTRKRLKPTEDIKSFEKLLYNIQNMFNMCFNKTQCYVPFLSINYYNFLYCSLYFLSAWFEIFGISRNFRKSGKIFRKKNSGGNLRKKFPGISEFPEIGENSGKNSLKLPVFYKTRSAQQCTRW